MSSDTDATTIVAVDPGITGALAWLTLHKDGSVTLHHVADFPTASAKSGATTKNFIQSSVLAQMVLNPVLPRPSALVVEAVGAMPGQGVTSMFRFGQAAGIIEGIAAALALPYHTITPQTWGKAVGIKRGDDAGRLRAVQLFPEQAQSFARKKDHNRADAALIGYGWLRLHHQNFPINQRVTSGPK